jgi:hypothetical protein
MGLGPFKYAAMCQNLRHTCRPVLIHFHVQGLPLSLSLFLHANRLTQDKGGGWVTPGQDRQTCHLSEIML